MISWVTDYLSDRPQFFRLKSGLSEQHHRDLCYPSFSFPLYTTEFQYMLDLGHLQKFSSDSVMFGYIIDGQEEEYRDFVDKFVE